MMRMASRCQKVPDISLLLAQRGDRSENALSETQASVTLRTKTAFAPQDPRRKARSAALLVGSTPSCSTKVHKAGAIFKY
jgi:hypothetical protein